MSRDADERAGDDLVTLLTTRSGFEASAVVALLAEAGIDAFAFDAGAHTIGITTSRRLPGAVVQVRRRERERARAALDEQRHAAADIDWDAVDVGEFEPTTPSARRRGMPWPARIAFIVTLLVALVGLIGMVYIALF